MASFVNPADQYTEDRRGSGVASGVGRPIYDPGMESTWESRDLPVLSAVVDICDENEWGEARPNVIADRTGLPLHDVNKALWRLAGERPPFFEVSDASDFDGREILSVSNPSGHAQRTVGTWPTAEGLTDRIAAAFAAAADAEPEVERKGVLRRGAEFFGGIGKDVTAEVIAKVITQGM